jgi:hypothetical protein
MLRVECFPHLFWGSVATRSAERVAIAAPPPTANVIVPSTSPTCPICCAARTGADINSAEAVATAPAAAGWSARVATHRCALHCVLRPENGRGAALRVSCDCIVRRVAGCARQQVKQMPTDDDCASSVGDLNEGLVPITKLYVATTRTSRPGSSD